MSRCRSCNAEIIWAETAGGKRMPLDVEPVIPDIRGLQVLIPGRGDQGEDLVRSATADDVALTRFYRSHFATCPNADKHRSPR